MLRIVPFLLGVLACFGAGPLQAQRAPDSPHRFGPFFEPDFPFVTTTVNTDTIGRAYPARSLTVRGPVVRLGHGAYAVFDPDLLRMAAAWVGDDALELNTMAPVSYHQAGNKRNGIPRLNTPPVFVTGLYPGWMDGRPVFRDPRPAGPNPAEPGRGPVDPARGRWNGLHVVGDRVVFDYTVHGVAVLEQPGSLRHGHTVGITRTFRLGPTSEPLTLVAAEIGNGTKAVLEGRVALAYHGVARDTVTAIGTIGAPEGAWLDVQGNRYLTLGLPAGTPASSFTLVIWKGPATDLDAFRRLLALPAPAVVFDRIAGGGPARWGTPAVTRGIIAPDSAAFVTDVLTLPLPNRWHRNVRVADLAFFPDGRAAVSTFDGDVWILSGLDAGLERLTWRRFASGLYEPMSIEIVDGQIYTFGRDGIVRLHDRNGDGEADFYENFCNLAVQTNESREFPLDMVARPEGGFYLAKGAASDAGPRTSPRVMSGFRAGGVHSGTVLEVSPDGRRVRIFADGFREPYIGIHPETGWLTASDQQGHFVPSTPIYAVRDGGFYGVPATAHRPGPPPEEPPLTWIPHRVDRSGAGQVWALTDRLGPLNGALIHISYGEPAIYRVYRDDDGAQGGIARIPLSFTVPVQKGAVHPLDHLLYLGGFQVWDSNARDISGLVRLRYTGGPTPLPAALQAGRRGLLLRFDHPLDAATALDATRYAVRRWNYRRTGEYGSGYFTLDGTPGVDSLVAVPHLSADRRAVFLAVPDMQEVMQMEVVYHLRTADGTPLDHAAYLTVNRLRRLDVRADGFGTISMPAPAVATATPPAATGAAGTASVERGRLVYEQFGCMACHSADGSLEGKTGPTFRGLYGAARPLQDGRTVTADDAYLRRSILDPAAEVVAGYEVGMASYNGILTETQIQSLILFIRSLGTATP